MIKQFRVLLFAFAVAIGFCLVPLFADSEPKKDDTPQSAIPTQTKGKILLYLDFDAKNVTEENKVGYFKDLSGNQYLAKIVGAKLDKKGKIGDCVSFDGKSYLVVDGPLVTEGMTTCTLSFWFKSKSEKMQAPIQEDWTGLYALVNRFKGGDFYPAFDHDTEDRDDNDKKGFGDSACNGHWHHLAGIHDNGETRIYIDGKLVGKNKEKLYWSKKTNKTCFIGKGMADNGDGRYVNGQIDDLVVLDCAISNEEVASIYKSTKSGFVGVDFYSNLELSKPKEANPDEAEGKRELWNCKELEAKRTSGSCEVIVQNVKIKSNPSPTGDKKYIEFTIGDNEGEVIVYLRKGDKLLDEILKLKESELFTIHVSVQGRTGNVFATEIKTSK